jgi:ribosomal protein S18 acetylase RimI-like enzyme
VPEQPPVTWAIEELAGRHDRSSFDCGSRWLNEFLRRYAAQNQRLGISRTYVAVPPGSTRVEGYYSISSGSVRFADLPEGQAKRLPRYPVPVAHLGRLAVHEPVQGLGLGRLLLMDALERIVRAAQVIGIHAVEVLAEGEAGRRFYRKYGFVALRDDPLHLYVSVRALRKLGLV